MNFPICRCKEIIAINNSLNTIKTITNRYESRIKEYNIQKEKASSINEYNKCIEDNIDLIIMHTRKIDNLNKTQRILLNKLALYKEMDIKYHRKQMINNYNRNLPMVYKLNNGFFIILSTWGNIEKYCLKLTETVKTNWRPKIENSN